MLEFDLRPPEAPPQQAAAAAHALVTRADARAALPDSPKLTHEGDPGPPEMMSAIRRVVGRRAHESRASVTSKAMLQRLPAVPNIRGSDNTTAAWEKYFDDLQPLLEAFRNSAQPRDLDLPATMSMSDVRTELQTKVIKPLAAFRGNLVKDNATWIGLEAKWQALRALAEQVKSYSERDQTRLTVAPTVAPTIILTAQEEGWVTDIEREARAIPLDAGDAAAIAASVRFVRSHDGISKDFLRLIARVFAELSAGSDRFDLASLSKHLCKLKVDKEGFSGIIAEVEAALMLLKLGLVTPEVEIKMGEEVSRPAPYNATTVTQDVDILYDDTHGVPTLVEVKDSVITLEKKMNQNAGGKYTPSPVAIATVPPKHEHHYDPMQVSSLVGARDAIATARGTEASLRIVCVRPKGWVRFILSRHCLTLAGNQVILQIGNIEFTPSKLRAFQSDLERRMDITDPAWRIDQRADKTGRTIDRDQVMWDYERSHPWGTIPFTH